MKDAIHDLVRATTLSFFGLVVVVQGCASLIGLPTDAAQWKAEAYTVATKAIRYYDDLAAAEVRGASDDLLEHAKTEGVTYDEYDRRFRVWMNESGYAEKRAIIVACYSGLNTLKLWIEASDPGPAPTETVIDIVQGLEVLEAAALKARIDVPSSVRAAPYALRGMLRRL
jgi:hypothetical protein